MPGTKILTKLDATTCLKIAWRAAQDLGFSLTPIDGSQSFTASKGNALMSMLAGPLAPHCRFQVSVATYSDANEVVVERNNPWLTSGMVGTSRVNRQADELTKAVIAAVEKEGGTVIERKEF